MTLAAATKFQWKDLLTVDVFKKALFTYFLFYALVEIPYLDLMYSTPIEFFGERQSVFEGFFKFIKNSHFLIHGLHYLKILFILMVLFYKNPMANRIAVGFTLAIISIFIIIGHNASPEQRYLNFALLTLLLFPAAFKNLGQRTMEEKYLTHILWFIFGISYTLSGLFKFYTPEWYDGEFMKQYIHKNHTFNTQFSFLIHSPPILLKLMTYFPLFAELFALPLSLIPRFRFGALTCLTLMQFSLLFVAKIPQITLGMLIFHFLMFITLYNKEVADT